MANDIYQNNVLPDGTLRPQASAGKVDNPLDPLRDTTNILHELDYRYKKIQAQNEQAKQDQFESDLQLKQAEFNEQLKTITNQQEFDDAIAKYNSDIDTLGVNVMGEAGYKKWSNEKGRNYKQLSSLGYKSIWAKNMQKQTYASVATAVDNYAVLASMQSDPDRRKFYINKANGDIKSEVLDPEQKVALTNRFNMQLANAEVVRDINNDPQKAIDNLQAVDEKNKKPAYYDGLTPVQRQSYLQQAKQKYEAQLNTYNDRKIKDIKEKFADLYENVGYHAAYDFYKTVTENPASTAQENGMTQEQLKAFENWAKGVLKETNTQQAIPNQERFGDLQEKIKSMGITFDRKKGEYKVNKKKDNKVEDIVETITDINTGLQDGTYYVNDKKVRAMREELRTVLGDIVDGKIRLRDTDVEGQTFLSRIKNGSLDGDVTASEYISDSILKVLNNKTNINNFNLDKLSARDKGEIFEHVYYSALANNIDLKSHYIGTKQQIDILTQDTFNWMIQNRFNVPQKEYGAVVGDGNMYDTNNQKAKNNIGKKAAGYGSYVIDSKGTIKFVDNKGNIIDEVK